MSSPPTYQTFKKDQKFDEGGAINKNYDNTNLAFNLYDGQKNEEITKEDNVQKLSKLIKPENLTNSNNQSQHGNEDLENIFEQKTRHFKRSARTTPIQHSEEFLEDNTCPLPLAGQAHLQITSIDGFFNRKRGRPPKNRFVEVYKNTQQKPQAIFTSFKLEKHGTNETAANTENGANHFLRSDLETLKNYENYGNAPKEYSRHKPHNINSTQRKRSYEKMNNNSTHSRVASSKTILTRINFANTPLEIEDYDLNDDNDDDHNEIIFLKNSKQTGKEFTSFEKVDINCTTPLSMDAHEGQTCLTYESISTNSVPASCKQKLCGTTGNVTVVRAAGTFYPENSNEMAKFTDIFFEKLRDRSEKKCSSSTSAEYKEDIRIAQNSNTFNCNDMPQDLSIKDPNPHETSALEFSSSTATTSAAAALPQILNVLQTQQQLLAFYQQMAVMAPTFSQFDFKTFLMPTVTPPLPTAGTKTTYSPSMNISDQDLQQKLFSLNMFLKLQQINQEQKLSVNKEITISESDTQKEAITAKSLSPPHNRISFQNKTTADSDTTLASDNQHPSSSRLLQGLHFYNGRERTPSGYLRFRFNEDCGYDKCGYRQHQSHFHCNRSDCQYSFCDKTRFVQHTARHERLDTLMGSDFQQYRATMLCYHDNCPYNNSAEEYGEGTLLRGRKSSHFHCLKCEFVCADTNKVVAHRRLHSKLEFIRSAGFRKVASNENCMISPLEVNTNGTCGSDTSKQKTSEKFPIAILPEGSASSSSSSCIAFKNPPDSSDILKTNNISHCPYYMRHAHYHCLICNCSVLSRSQLVAHKHRTTSISISPIPSLSDASTETITTKTESRSFNFS